MCPFHPSWLDPRGGAGKSGAPTKPAVATRSSKTKKSAPLPITPFTDNGAGSQREQLRGFGFSEPQIDTLQEMARALARARRPPMRPPVRRTKARAPLLDYLLPPHDKAREAIAWIAALHAYKPAGLQHPRRWGLYSTAFVETVRMCFETAGLQFPKHALAQYQHQARRKRLTKAAALRSTPTPRAKS